MSKLFTEAECLSIVESASGRPFCSPPAVKTESAQGLAALAGSGQAVGNPPFVRLIVAGDSGRYEYVCHLRDYPRWAADLAPIVESAHLVGSLV